MNDLSEAMKLPPSAAGGAALAEWLRSVDRTGDGWEALFDALLPLCERTAREFADVATPDEARSACMENTYERWLGEWLDTAARALDGKPFATFVGDRLHDHLRAMRRKRQRRAAMQHEVAAKANGHAVECADASASRAFDTAFTGSVEAPDAAVRQRQLYDRVEAHERVGDFERNVLRLLLRAHPQKEIARILGSSEPTVSRAVALLRSLFDNALSE